MRLAIALFLSDRLPAPGSPRPPRPSKPRRDLAGTLFPPAIHQSFRIEALLQALRDHGYVEGEFHTPAEFTDAERFYRRISPRHRWAQGSMSS